MQAMAACSVASSKIFFVWWMIVCAGGMSLDTMCFWVYAVWMRGTWEIAQRGIVNFFAREMARSRASYRGCASHWACSGALLGLWQYRQDCGRKHNARTRAIIVFAVTNSSHSAQEACFPPGRSRSAPLPCCWLGRCYFFSILLCWHENKDLACVPAN